MELTNSHNPSNEVISVTKLPEQFDGFVDTEILADINKYLSQSENSDDIALATWVKQNYLYEPVIEAGRPIRDSEGFSNLDKAYRRVRYLTGKAQDKWPFFDKAWKKMSSSVVKNAILGDAAMSQLQTVSNSQGSDTLMTNSFGDQQGRTSGNRNATVSSNTGNTVDQLAQKGKTPPPTEHSTWDTRHPANGKAPDQSSGSNIAEGPQDVAKDISASTVALNGTSNSTGLLGINLRDAGAGKVRASKRASAGDGNEEDHTSGNEVARATQTPSDNANIPSDATTEGHQGESELGTNARSIESTPNVPDTPAFGSAILAAEAAAVRSNLDRLPPGHIHKKRKSEDRNPLAGDLKLKRARGSRGGVLGRPRKSDISANRESGATQGQSEATSKIPALRSSRRSDYYEAEVSTPWDPAADVLFNGITQGLSTNNANSIAVNNTTEAQSSKRSSRKGSIDVDTRAGTEPVIAALDWDTPTPTDTPSSRSTQPYLPPTLNKHKKRVSISPESTAGQVQFFARVTTSAGIREFPLIEEDLTSEVALVKRYAAWQDAGNENVTFDIFKNIVKFNR
ncbi:hypothetical protein G6514_006811 [Epicoccum nigrum]|nr:hypothetical protein G6514_006811 [Epicoccum nigrum]